MSLETEIPDYYDLLGVSFDATDKEIKQAYRKLALLKHPDRNLDNPNANAIFALIVEAHAVLSNKDNRTKYNEKYKELQNIKARKLHEQQKFEQMDSKYKDMVCSNTTDFFFNFFFSFCEDCPCV